MEKVRYAAPLLWNGKVRGTDRTLRRAPRRARDRAAGTHRLPQRTDRTPRSAHRDTYRRHARRPGATGHCPPDNTGEPAYLAAVDRLDEITGIGRHAAQAIIAEVGLSMAIFPTAAHPVSWAKISPRANQSGTKTRSGETGKGNHYLTCVLGEAAASAGRTNTFLGARYRRLARRIGKLKALVAVARSILVIVWHLLSPTPPAATAIVAPSSPTTGSGPNAARSTTSANSKHSATPSPSPQQPDYQPWQQYIWRSGNRDPEQ